MITLCNANALRIPLPSSSVDTVVTDPPYGLSFMGKDWDYGVPGIVFWAEVLRVAKPGAMMLAFGGTRTHHRLMCNIEDAGWEMRDVIMWVYGSGFPKSHDISKAIDKAAGAEREVVGIAKGTGKQNPTWNGTDAGRKENALKPEYALTAPATPAAQLWHGWGTALKPAWEPIIVAMKPLDGTFANNALKWGVAGLWVDGGRVIAKDGVPKFNKRNEGTDSCYGDGLNGSNRTGEIDRTTGRWPANLTHDGSDEVVGLFPVTKSGLRSPHHKDGGKEAGILGAFPGAQRQLSYGGDQGSAARFFYCAKASTSERSEGNNHPTVKPLSLMRYLCRITKTPTGGIVLDPFCGSGSTGIAARLEGRDFIGLDIDAGYCSIAYHRINEHLCINALHEWQHGSARDDVSESEEETWHDLPLFQEVQK